MFLISYLRSRLIGVALFAAIPTLWMMGLPAGTLMAFAGGAAAGLICVALPLSLVLSALGLVPLARVLAIPFRALKWAIFALLRRRALPL